MKKIKVRVVIGSLDIGGAEMDIVRNFPKLDRNVFDVAVVVYSHRGPLADRLEDAGIRVICPERLSDDQDPDTEIDQKPKSSQHDEELLSPLPTEKRNFRTDHRRLIVCARKYLALLRPLVRLIYRLKRFLLGCVWHQDGDADPRSLNNPQSPLNPRVLHRNWRNFIGTQLYIARTVLWLRAIFKQEQPEIIHAFLPASYLYSTLAHLSLLGKRSLVMSRLSLSFYSKTHPWLFFFERAFCHRFVSCVIGNSKAVIEDLKREGLASNKLRLIYNGIETGQYRKLDTPSDGGKTNVLIMTAVANLHAYKGYDDLLVALKRLIEYPLPPWKVLIAGRDQEGNLARYIKFCGENGLSAHVQFLGQCDDVASLLGKSDIHLHVSRTEGLPNSIVEAMSAGLPVIGTSVGGIPELILDGVTGLIVPPQNPEALSRAIVTLIENPDFRRQLGEEASVRARESFDVKRSVQDYEKLYKDLLSNL